jgi:phospholipid/cholesterol/gamma-HCH transport system permease protein
MSQAAVLQGTTSRYEVSHEGAGVLRVRFTGPWTLAGGVPSPRALASELEGVTRIVLDAQALAVWDSALVSVVFALAAEAEGRGIELDTTRLPEAAQELLRLARAVKPRRPEHPVADRALTARVGRSVVAGWDTAWDALGFLGSTAQALGKLVRGQAQFRGADLWQHVEESGLQALGIVALMNFLMGAVLAFVGAVQLQQFGAAIYVADLVAIGVCRELGALMTGIVMAGRTGASYAAVLGTMTVNEEIDALRTMSLRPIEFLVAPRVLAVALMMPVLVVYADLFGLLGGSFVGVALLDLGRREYLRATLETLALRHIFVGLAKGVAFGVVVAVAGSFYGMRCGRSAASVGEATTRAVVVAIMLVVVVDAIFTVALHFLNV